MSSYAILTVGVLLAVILDLWFVLTQEHYKRLQSQYEQENKDYKKTNLLAAALNETFKDLHLDKVSNLYKQKIAHRLNYKIIVELVILFVWAMVISKPYLNMDVRVIPAGSEFNSAIQTHHLWTRAQECGWCAMWNESVRGGYPAFVDIHGSALHPLVIVTTLLWGVINGSKISLFLSFWLGGMAQWWLSRELKVSALARVFTAGIAISGGHITSRMELGAFGVVLSTVMVSLVFPAVLYVLRRKDNKSIVIFAIILASAILSGQGYMQVGLVLMSPAFLVLLWQDRFDSRLWGKFSRAISIAMLLAAPFLVPFLHFSSQIVKETDIQFSSAQPLVYMPLNLVIDDPFYYRNNTFDKLPYPHLTANFIGWIPVALAVIGVIRANSENRRIIIFMLTGILLVYLTASGILLKSIALIYPGIGGVRHPTQISGLAVPLLLVLASYGIDTLENMIRPIRWGSRSKETSATKYRLSLFWVLIFPLLGLGLLQTYNFSAHWLSTVRIEPRVYELINALKKPSLDWVNPPYGEHIYVQPAIEAGLKISPGSMTWKWRDREFPSASLEANRVGPPSENSVQVNFVDGITIYERTDNPYAAIYSGESVYPCLASGTGGKIRIECDAPQHGLLIVQENMWTGWQARQDGQRIELLDSQYLEVSVSTGRHIYQFNYLPWDVPTGIVFSLAGILICLRVWRLRKKQP